MSIFVLIIPLIVFTIQCIIHAWWNIILIIFILSSLWWCKIRKKNQKPIWQGVLVIIISFILLAWFLLPCLYGHYKEMLEEAEEEQRQEQLAIEKQEENKKKEQIEKEKEQPLAKEQTEKERKIQEAQDKKPVYDYSVDKDCSDFDNESEATSFMKASVAAGHGDHRLDRNKDGKACN